MFVRISYTKYCIAGFLAGIRVHVQYTADATSPRPSDGSKIRDTTGNTFRVEGLQVSPIAQGN